MENLITYACSLTPGGPTDKKNRVKMFKKYLIGTVEIVRIWIPIKVESRIRIKMIWIRNTVTCPPFCNLYFSKKVQNHCTLFYMYLYPYLDVYM